MSKDNYYAITLLTFPNPISYNDLGTKMQEGIITTWTVLMCLCVCFLKVENEGVKGLKGFFRLKSLILNRSF